MVAAHFAIVPLGTASAALVLGAPLRPRATARLVGAELACFVASACLFGATVLAFGSCSHLKAELPL